ncbi:MAG: PHP domain-containing protein [Planctomycetota bacterium]
MSEYMYETHLHTSEVSRCADSEAKEFVRFFNAIGYTGIFITDHFNGNTTVEDETPWERRIELFCRGYNNAVAEGDKIGVDVFLAWEYGSGWSHFLTYGLGRDWLLDNPDMLSWGPLEYLDRVHEAGGYIVHAHPFREGVELIQLMPDKVDAVEVLNAGRSDDANVHARDFADSFGLPKTAGSDIHSVGAGRLCNVISSVKFHSSADYAEAVETGQIELIDKVV